MDVSENRCGTAPLARKRAAQHNTVIVAAQATEERI
jgi:hypothetical protein